MIANRTLNIKKQ